MSKFQNPFITSTEVHAEEDFFDRKELLREIEKFIERKKDYNFLLYGQRRIGKTSVLKKIERLYKDTNSEAIYITLQGEAETYLDDLLKKIAQRVIERIGFKYRKKINATTFISEFLPYLKTVLKDKKVILLFDEFDVLGDLESIWQFKKSFSFHRFIPYCADIIEKVKLDEIPFKIIFAIGRNYKDFDTERFGQITKFGQQAEIGFFDEEIVLELLAQSDELIPFTYEAKKNVFEITGGHPYFSQCLAHIAFDEAQDDNFDFINPKLVEKCLPIAIKRYSNGVIWIWDTLTAKDKIILYIAAELAENKTEINEKNIKIASEELSVLAACDKLSETLDRLNNIKFLRQKDDDNYVFYVEYFRKWVISEIDSENIQRYFTEIDVEIDNLLTNARFYFVEKNYSEAENLFKQVTSFRPEHYEALFYSAKCKHFQNDKTAESYKTIFELYNNAYRLNPAYKTDEFLSFLNEYYDFTENNNISNKKVARLIKKLNPKDVLGIEPPIEELEIFKKSTDKLVVIYDYNYLPPSIIRDFVKLMEIDVKNVWRTGAFLKRKSDTKAIILTTKNRITVSVIGSKKKRSEYLSVIRYFMDKTNSQSKLNVDFLLSLPDSKNKTVKYSVLLNMQRSGETIFKDWEDEKEYNISELLSGIEAAETINEQAEKFDNIYLANDKK